MPAYEKCSNCKRTLLWSNGVLVCVNGQCPGHGGRGHLENDGHPRTPSQSFARAAANPCGTEGD